MRRAVFHGPGDITVEETPDLRIEEPGDVLVRVSTIVGTAARPRRPSPVDSYQ